MSDDEMATKIINQCEKRFAAKAQAYEEAASHLEHDWTDDPVEREEGNKIAKRLFALAREWGYKASVMKAANSHKSKETPDA